MVLALSPEAKERFDTLSAPQQKNILRMHANNRLGGPTAIRRVYSA